MRMPAPTATTRRRPGTGVRLTAAAALAAAASVLTACGTTPTDPKAPPPAPSATAPGPPSGEHSDPPPLPQGKPGTPQPGLPDPGRVNGQDPDAVGRAALTAMWTIDTMLDVTQHDATLRAVPYLTDTYARQIRGAPQRANPGAAWTEWTAHQAYTVVTLQAADEAGKPADTATDAYRTWITTATPRGRDGWSGQPVTHTSYVHLTRPSAEQPWKVATVRTF